MSESTPGYGELSARAASKVVDSLAESAQRSIRYSRAVWEIFSKPYESTSLREIVMTNFDRATELANVTARETKAQIDATQQLNEVLLEQSVKIQDAYLNVLRGVLDVGFSNLTFVQNAAAATTDDLSRRFEKYTTPARAASSSN